MGVAGHPLGRSGPQWAPFSHLSPKTPFSKLGFVGTISPAIANLTSLNLNDNHLIGSISDNLACLPDLQIFDISNNNLTGSIPKFTSTFGSDFLRISIKSKPHDCAPLTDHRLNFGRLFLFGFPPHGGGWPPLRPWGWLSHPQTG
jgi:hypothetical protein